MRIYLDSIGCRLNQSEIEKIGNQFITAGHQLVSSAEDADLVIVNTCAVTTNAVADSRGKIRQASSKGSGDIIVTGCWATLDPEEAAALPNVQAIITNADKERLVEMLLGHPTNILDNSVKRHALPGEHNRTRAFIKVQDGCNNHCTYCITRIVRGRSRSTPLSDVLADIQAAINGGVNEVVLSGVQLGSWGQDLSQPLKIKDLIRSILLETDIRRLRLSSLEPWDLDEEFFLLWNDRRLCRHLHLPLQSGTATVLRRMGRKTTPEKYAALVENARAVSPEIAITTDVMVGFPGENDTEFEQSIDFIRKMRFAGGHVFSFSPRPGTVAESMPNRLPQQVSKARSTRMRGLMAEARQEYSRQFVGQSLPVLWETYLEREYGWSLEGLTDNYLRIRVHSDRKLWNEFTQVSITGWDGEGLVGIMDIIGDY